jgi:hypothetical protein
VADIRLDGSNEQWVPRRSAFTKDIMQYRSFDCEFSKSEKFDLVGEACQEGAFCPFWPISILPEHDFE